MYDQDLLSSKPWDIEISSYPIFAPGYWSDIQHQYPEIPSSRKEVNELTIEIEDSLQNGPSRSMSAVTEPSMMKNMMANQLPNSINNRT